MTYNFYCNDCEKDFIEERSMNDVSPIKCECGSENVKRIYKSANVNLSFSGSYNSTR